MTREQQVHPERQASRTDGVNDVPDDDLAYLNDVPDVPTDRLTHRAFGWWLVIAGLVGFVGSLLLSIERVLSLKDPDRVGACDLSAFVTCGPAMDSAQGSILGFPNPFIGVAAFPVVVTIGVFLIVARTPMPRWFWRALLAGASLGMGLVVFLVATSLYSLRALCPYCMVVWVATIPLFVYSVAFARQEGALGTRGSAASWIVRNRIVVLVGMYAALVMWVFAVLGGKLLG